MKKSLLKILTSFALLALLTGCATSIPMTVTRPAELNLNGAKSVAVLPTQTELQSEYTPVGILGLFTVKSEKASKENLEKSTIASQFTNELLSNLMNDGYMYVVGGKFVENALTNGTDIPCDIYITGELASFEESIRSDSYTNEEGEKYYKYEKQVDVTINYKIIDAKTNKILSIKSKKLSNKSSQYEYKSSLPSASSIIHTNVENLAKAIMKELRPYTETYYITLLSDKTKDESMKLANQYAKNKKYDLAYQTFMECYEANGYYEAGYNAACLLEVLGDLYNAETLMKDVYQKTSEKKAAKTLQHIREEIKYKEKLDAQNAAQK